MFWGVGQTRLRPLFVPRRLVTCAFFVACSLLAQTPGWATLANVDVIVLKQKSDVFGSITTYINEKHLKIVIGKPNVYLLANAPEWRVMVCNDANGRALTMSIKQWMEHFPQTTYFDTDWDRCNTTMAFDGMRRLLGRSCRHYYFPIGTGDKDGPPPGSSIVGSYYLLDQHYTDVSACHILQKAVSAPILPAVPLAFSQTQRPNHVEAFSAHFGGTEHWLGTESISEAKMPASFFVYHNGYKAVQKEVEVMDDKSKQDSVDDVARELLPR